MGREHKDQDKVDNTTTRCGHKRTTQEENKRQKEE